MLNLRNNIGRNYMVDVSLGLVPDAQWLVALGNNPDIDTGIPEDVWSGGGLYPWMTAATALELVGLNAADTAAGTGARVAVVVGLDANYVEVPQMIALNGVTPVLIPIPLLRINAVIVLAAGSVGVNVGDINVRDAGGGTIRAMIPAGYGTTRQSQYTVPAGQTLCITSLLFSINRPTSTRDATVATYARPMGGAFIMALELSVASDPFLYQSELGIPLAEKTDFGLRCNYVSTSNTDLTAAWTGVLHRSDVL